MTLPDDSILLRLREGWLVGAVVLLHEHMQECRVPTAPFCRVSCGFPYARRGLAADRIKGQCFSPKYSRDGMPQIFINPLYDDSIEVAAILLHELIHAGIGLHEGHGKLFSQSAKKVGLVKPWTATTASDGLRMLLEAHVQVLGHYPHAALVDLSAQRQPGESGSGGQEGSRQGSRLRLHQCSCQPPIKARVARDEFRAKCEDCQQQFQRVP